MTLHCRARGNPRPHIEWSKEGLPLTRDPRFEVRPSGDLFIRVVRMVDYGMYRCRATNRAGGVAASTRLVVEGISTYSDSVLGSVREVFAKSSKLVAFALIYTVL